MEKRKGRTGLIMLLSGTVIGLVVVSFPLGFFITSYYGMVHTLDAEAEINAQIVSSIIKTNPEFWEFEQARLQEYLSSRPKKGFAETRRIVNTKNEIVAESVDKLERPVVMRSYKLADAGVIVGKIEIARSLRPILKQTGLMALSVFFLGLGAFLIIYIIPIRRMHRAEKALQESELKFRTLFEDSRDAIFITTRDGRFLDFNLAFLELFGYTKEEMAALYSKDTYMNSTDRDIYIKAIKEKGAVRNYEVKLRKKDGQQMDCLITAAIRYDNGNISGYQGTIRNITEEKQMEERLHTLSIIDDLTGLYNRRGFFALSQQQMKAAERARKDMLLFFADLDKMKQINDTLGHQEGDNALLEIASILKEVFRESDIIGRMGGDEFAVLAIDTTDETKEVLRKRLHAILETYNRPDKKYQLSLSVGISHYDPEYPSSLDELMAQADTLMYEEKRGKRR